MILARTILMFPVIAMTLVIDGPATSQNLVPNSSFEDVNFDYCGLFPSVEQFEKANKYWSAPNESRPEIFSLAVDPSCWNYANRIAGVKPRSGQRGAMIQLYSVNNSRSYLQVQLTKALVKGRSYSTQIFVRPVKWSLNACNNLGIYFSDSLIRVKGRGVLNFTPHINHDVTLTDTTNWLMLAAKFKATSNSKYIIIGNFFDDQTTRVEAIKPNKIQKKEPIFYLVDDISVVSESDR